MDYSHPIIQEYIESCKELGAYVRANTLEPGSVSRRHKNAIHNIRDYLDSIGIEMPAPNFPFDHRDKSTWRYLDVVLTGGREKRKIYVRSVINPNYRYQSKEL